MHLSRNKQQATGEEEKRVVCRVKRKLVAVVLIVQMGDGLIEEWGVWRRAVD